MDEKEMLEKQQEAEKGYDALREDMMGATDSIRGTLINDLHALIKAPGLSAVKALGSNLYGKTKGAIANTEAVMNARREIDKEVAAKLVQMLNSDIKRITEETMNSIDAESKSYLEVKKKEVKDALIKVITGSDVLSDDKKKELSDIIIRFEVLDYLTDNSAFAKEDYEKVIRLGRATIGFTDQINLEKLRRDYNNKLHSLVQSIYADVRTSHIKSFEEWLQSLQEVLENNIIEYSPVLRNQVELIKEETARIQDLEMKQQKLADYTEQIRRMMAWKEV